MPGVTNGYGWDERSSSYELYSRREGPPRPDYYRREENFSRRDDSFSKYGGSSSNRQIYTNGTSGYTSDQHSELSEDGPTYILEHLATFTVGSGLAWPADGLRRLRQMEKSSGIWTQKMQMRLEKKWLTIIDFENAEVVERFPIHLISEPTAFMSSDPKEIYNNILLFIVQEDPNRKNFTPSEMHVFQCIRASAQEVVEEMKRYLSGGKGRASQGNRRDVIPPPPSSPAPEPPLNGVSVREHVNHLNAQASAAETDWIHNGAQASELKVDSVPKAGQLATAREMRHKSSSQMASQSHMQHSSREMSHEYSREMRSVNSAKDHDEEDSTASENYEKEVATLNHCFDDIERFIARLQQASAAFKELERRRRHRKTKKKDVGDGMLSFRAKPPPEKDFIDVFQKFKLSFNLLAKLKQHIHDPNAPELVHFLFTPLALVVDACRDSNYGPNLAARVESPLLSRDAIDLLHNCLTSKESDLWHSLGDTWTIPRDQWKGYVPIYYPVFSDGWQPHVVLPEEREKAEQTANAVVREAQMRRGDEIWRTETEADARERDYHYDRNPDRERGYSEYNNDREESARGGSSAYGGQKSSSYEVRNEMRSTSYAPAGNRSSVPPSRSPNDRHSEIGITPVDYPSLDHRISEFERQQRQYWEEIKNTNARVFQVVYPRTANNEKELSVQKGEILEVIDDSRKWWKCRNSRGQMAHVPNTILTPFQGEDDAGLNSAYRSREYYTQESRGERGYYGPATSSSAPPSNLGPPRQGKKELELSHSREDLRPVSPRLVDDSQLRPLSPRPRPLSPPLLSPQEKLDIERVMTQQDILQEELKTRMTYGKNRNIQDARRKTPTLYLNQYSTEDEVKDWLISKGFSQRTVRTLEGQTGSMLFSLTRHQLEQYCGKDEGSRLDSQLTVQKNICGYGTASASELQAILQRRKERADTFNNDNSMSGEQTRIASNSEDEDLESGWEGGRTLRDLLRKQRRKILKN